MALKLVAGNICHCFLLSGVVWCWLWDFLWHWHFSLPLLEQITLFLVAHRTWRRTPSSFHNVQENYSFLGVVLSFLGSYRNWECQVRCYRLARSPYLRLHPCSRQVRVPGHQLVILLLHFLWFPTVLLAQWRWGGPRPPCNICTAAYLKVKQT